LRYDRGVPDLNEPEADACPFCNREVTRNVLLYEGRDFYIIADYAPIAEAHLLLIPRGHFPHLAALPPALHEEFESLKAWLGGFVRESYGSLTFWENGVFGQSVPHAHLHAISVNFDSQVYAPHGHGFSGIGGLQERHSVSGGSHYFTIEQRGQAHFLPPDWDLYLSIVRFARNSRPINWRFDREERRLRGRPIIDALMERWRAVMDGQRVD
jgi:diadenosine tetraphosphate (Ap4A) HIT family hydrolase